MKRLAGLVSIIWISCLPLVATAQSLSFEELIGEQSATNPEQTSADAGSGGDLYERVGRAVGVVVLVNASNVRQPAGTAWGAAPGVFATNAHVADLVLKWTAAGGRAQVQMNNSVREIYAIKSARMHPAYNSKQHAYDVATLTVTARDHPLLPIADDGA